MIINPTADMDIIRAIISCEEITSKYLPTDDILDVNTIVPTKYKEFATFEVEKQPVGVLVMDNVCDGVLSIHPYLLDCAKPLFRDMWNALVTFLTWYRLDVSFLSVSIQTCHDRLIKLCTYYGFVPFYEEYDHGIKYGKKVNCIHMINSNWRVL